jgi:small subunit ribosomal protein S8
MTMTDPIADLFTRIRNAGMARHRAVEIPHSRIKTEIVRILKANRMIADYRVMTDRFPPKIRVLLKYAGGETHVIRGMKRVSKPGLRIYAGKKELPMVRKGLGFAIISTPQGIMTDRDCRQNGVGGEVLGYVW